MLLQCRGWSPSGKAGSGKLHEWSSGAAPSDEKTKTEFGEFVSRPLVLVDAEGRIKGVARGMSLQPKMECAPGGGALLGACYGLC